MSIFARQFQNLLGHIAQAWPCLAVIALFIAAQSYKAMMMAPPPEYIWDNVYLWDWARNVSLGNFAALVPDSHHQLRWGDWLFPAILIQLFSDEVIFYYLASILPSVLAGAIFIYYCWRHIGVWQALIFSVLWFFDSELFRATFQLLPTSQSLLPIAILLLLTTRVAKERQVSTLMGFVIACGLFWLYGVKETYLAFAPGISWILWRVGGIRPVITIASVFVVGYTAETLLFHWMNSDFSLLGRLYALINGGQHVTIMLENPHYVGQQTQYFDSGITMRWVIAVGVSSIVYFPAYLFAILLLAQRETSGTPENQGYRYTEVVSIMLLSFMLFTTFFVISVSPIRLGHGLVSRYLAISLPFCYILLLSFLSLHLQGAKLIHKYAVLFIIPFFISPAINRFADYPELSISEISKRYTEFGKDFNRYDCIRARQKSIVRNQLDLIPLAYRGPTTKAIIANPEIETDNRMFLVRGGGSECQNTYTITRIETARY